MLESPVKPFVVSIRTDPRFQGTFDSIPSDVDSADATLRLPGVEQSPAIVEADLDERSEHGLLRALGGDLSNRCSSSSCHVSAESLGVEVIR